MGMFDWYRPKGIQRCPRCDVELKHWQSKDGPCGLLVWEQGQLAPVDQAVDEECRLEDDQLFEFRLPEQFEIYSYDCDKHGPAFAKCDCENGMWTKMEITMEQISHRGDALRRSPVNRAVGQQ